MTIEELKSHVSNWSAIDLVASKANGEIKKGWIKRYDLNESFDKFDSFDILIHNDKNKFKKAVTVIESSNNNTRVKEILISCINKDLNEGYTFVN